MIEEFFMPLDRHFDSGFGATADSFHEAAKALDRVEHKSGFGLNSSRLPVFYLYRHANELYLKSITTMLHRRFRSIFPHITKDDFPSIAVDGKPRKIFNVHSINDLYQQYRAFVVENSGQIKSIGGTDWTEVPAELDEMVRLIDDADKVSTMFRYPFTLDRLNDAKKSSFKRIDPTDAIALAHHQTKNNMPGVKILAIKNDKEEIAETFIHDNESMYEVFDALKRLADMLSGAQFGMHHDFLTTT